MSISKSAIFRRIVLALGLGLLLSLSAGCGMKSVFTGPGNAVFTQTNPAPSAGRAKTKPSRPYTVMGETYYPLASADGFVQTGVASWYGKDFHGKKTANGEIYNMYALTAAHKTLPLGARMQVTNLENGKSVIVDVNDRGPFVGTRIIDLSYAAAKAIGMHDKGLAKVRVTTVLDVPGPNTNIAQSPTKSRIPSSGAASAGKGTSGQAYYVQVGVFSQKLNAMKVYDQLVRSGIDASVSLADRGGRQFYHVRTAGFSREDSARRALERIRSAYPTSYIVAAN